MKLPTLFCVAVLMTVSAGRSWAQAETSPAPSPTPRPTPPAPPFLNATPEYSAWTISRYIIPGLGSQAADAVIRSAAATLKPDSVTSVTKTGEIRHQSGQVRHQIRKLKTGEQEDIWYEHGNRITMESIWKIPMFEGNTSGSKTPLGPDFPEVAWIAAGNFVGTQADHGVTYLVFETQVTEGNASQAKEYGYKLQSTFNRAYIDADTRMPWLHQTGDVLQRYAFLAAPTATLEVPQEYQTMFDTFEKKKLEANRKPVAP